MKNLNVCQCSDGFLATLTETRVFKRKEEVDAFIRHEGLRQDDTAFNEVSFSPSL